MNPAELILNASLPVQVVMGVLCLMSLIGLALILKIAGVLSTARREDHAFAQDFYADVSLSAIKKLASLRARTHLAGIFDEAVSAYAQGRAKKSDKQSLSDKTQRAIRVGLGAEQGRLESGLPLLASIGSVAPYIGLLGTVWGIMTAFLGLAESGSVGIDTIAPPIAEALIATAMGLVAAIPAAFFFNHLSAKAQSIYDDRAQFADELLGILLDDVPYE